MRAVVQRVSFANVVVNEITIGSIEKGLMILIGIEEADTQADIEWLVKKVVQMRIFSDEAGKMNLSVQDVQGDILLVSQFTLHASTEKGNRPSFIKAARPDFAIPMYENSIQQFEMVLGKKIQTGKFGADMKVNLLNDGPVTIWLDTKVKE